MDTATVIPRGGGEIIGDSPDRRVEVLSDDDPLHVTWSRFGPRREGADLHVHRRHADHFYVLSGELALRLGPDGEGVAVPAGTLARLPPMVVHGFRNATDAEVTYLNLHVPGQGFADYLRALRDGRALTYDQEPPPDDALRSTPEAVTGGRELVVDRPGLRVELLVDADEIGIAEVCSDPGAPPPPRHLHRRHVESFFVLEGELVVTAGERELPASPGSWVQVPAGVPHTFRAVGSRPVRYLNIHAPGRGFGTFLRALHAATDEEASSAARAAFDQEPAQ